MKRIILAVIFGVASLSSISTKAQVNLSINIGAQPKWGPQGYNHVDYYYLPEIESYYSVADRQYIYENNGRWITSRNLPDRYRNYDLYKGYKVVMNGPKPYLTHPKNVQQYNNYRGRERQLVIRDSRNNERNNRMEPNRGNQRDSRPDRDDNQRGGRRG